MAADFGVGEPLDVLQAPADVCMGPAWLAFFTLGRCAARTYPRRAPRLWGSVISLERCLASLGRCVANILPKARSNTAKPESLPDTPSTQSTELKPRACMTERDEALKVRGFWAGIGPGCVVSNSARA